MLTHPNTDPSPHLSLALSSPRPSPNIHLAQGRVEGLLRRSPHELPARLERLLQVVVKPRLRLRLRLRVRIRVRVRVTSRLCCRWWRCARMERAAAACRCCGHSARPEGG